MKKSLSLILALAVILSLAALCGCKNKIAPEATATPTAPAPTAAPATPAATATPSASGEITEETLRNAKPNEYIQQKLDAGMKPLIVFVTPLLSDNFIASIDKDFKTKFEALGFSYTTQDARSDSTQMLSNMENAVTMRAAAIIILAWTEGMGDMVKQCEDQGTTVVVFGAKPAYPVAGMVVLDTAEQGRQAAYMCHDWLGKVYPGAAEGSVSAMITINVSETTNKERSEAFQKYLPEDKRVKVAYVGTETTNSVDAGFQFAEEAFTMDPGLRLALCFSISAATGINNYIISRIAAADLGKYGIFCVSQDPDLFALIDAGGNNDQSCVRGTIAQGGKSASKGAYDCTVALLLGGAEYGYLEYDRMYAVTNFGYAYESKPDDE